MRYEDCSNEILLQRWRQSCHQDNRCLTGKCNFRQRQENDSKGIRGLYRRERLHRQRCKDDRSRMCCSLRGNEDKDDKGEHEVRLLQRQSKDRESRTEVERKGRRKGYKLSNSFHDKPF